MSTGSHLLGELSGRSQHHSLCSLQIHINLLQDGDSKGGGFSCARLSLCDDIIPYRQKQPNINKRGVSLLQYQGSLCPYHETVYASLHKS